MNVATIEELVTLALQVFVQVFNLFNHPTNPVPVTVAPSISSTLQATPGMTDNHKTVVATAVAAAVASTPAK